MTETKLAIMELFSKYLLCLDERRFDVNSFSEIFTENAEVIMPSRLTSGKECRGLQEIRDIHASLFLQAKSSCHTSSDYIFSMINDENAETRCKFSAYYNSFGDGLNDMLSVGEVLLSAVHTEDGWRIRRMKRNVQYVYKMEAGSKPKELFL